MNFVSNTRNAAAGTPTYNGPTNDSFFGNAMVYATVTARTSDWLFAEMRPGKWIARCREFLDNVRRPILRIRTLMIYIAAVLRRRTVKSTTPIRRYKPGGRK